MVKTGIIGMGIRGNLFAQTILFNPYAELVAFAEGDKKRLEEAKKKLSGKGYSDFNEMLEKEDLDLVIVALPDHLHREAVLSIAAKGCHTMIEKPLATTTEDAEKMAQSIKKSGKKAIIAFENRWSPVFLSARETINNGEIGEVRFMHSCLNDSIFVPTRMLGWASKSTPGWFLLPHSIDMALWLTGKKVSRVFAHGDKLVLREMGIDTYDSISTMIEFDDGTEAMFSTCWIYPESIPLIYDFRFEIVGTKGAISIDLRDQMIHKMTDKYTHPPILGRPVYGKPVGFAAEMLNSFIDNLRLNTEPVVSIDEGVYVVRVIDAIHQSIKTGKIEEVK